MVRVLADGVGPGQLRGAGPEAGLRPAPILLLLLVVAGAVVQLVVGRVTEADAGVCHGAVKIFDARKNI